jgi:hypothetical protein
MPEVAGPVAEFAGCPIWSPVREVAHCAQNLASDGFSKPHFWHRRLKGVALDICETGHLAKLKGLVQGIEGKGVFRGSSGDTGT